ncbi:MAG: CinA family nicotinamide mononucleotide deamidase-related protein [Proteobacteria bacterium]|nr:CinA family nicotinamide mononucleotide deamidase-related protein [Pseudomonadota bacterium]
MNRPKVFILLIGNELTRGSVADINGSLAARELRRIGFQVAGFEIVGDDDQAIERALRASGERAEVVIVGGGLGPTDDDRTRGAAARYFGRDLVFNSEAWENIEAWFQNLKRKSVPDDRRQAEFPAGAEMIPNRHGTAPGFFFRQSQTRYYFLQGVPREFSAFLQEEIIPRLRKEFSLPSPQIFRTLKVFGIGEGRVGAIIFGLARAFPQVTVGTRFYFPEIWIDLESEDGEALETVVSRARSEFSSHLFGENEETLESIVGMLLAEKGWKLALAESCTGGLVAHRITEVPGSSSYFERGVVTYSNPSKTELLGVAPDLLEKFGAVSAEVAGAMAEGVKKNSKVEIGLSTTGIAGPTGGSPEKPVGLVYFGLAAPEGVFTRKELLFGGRDRIKIFASAVALDWLRRYLQGEKI